jgi:hypothetical protein
VLVAQRDGPEPECNPPPVRTGYQARRCDRFHHILPDVTRGDPYPPRNRRRILFPTGCRLHRREKHHGGEYHTASRVRKGLKEFEEYIYKATPETYDGKEVKEMLDQFVEILVVHLSAEIQTLLALDKYGGEKLGPIWAQFNKKILAQVKDMVRHILPLAIVGEVLTDC